MKPHKLWVKLASGIDPFRFEQMSTAQKIQELQKPTDKIFYPVKDLKHAQDLCMEFIKEHDLGASNWEGGVIVDYEFNFIANVSYNGRIWDNIDSFKAKEIQL